MTRGLNLVCTSQLAVALQIRHDEPRLTQVLIQMPFAPSRNGRGESFLLAMTRCAELVTTIGTTIVSLRAFNRRRQGLASSAGK